MPRVTLGVIPCSRNLLEVKKNVVIRRYLALKDWKRPAIDELEEPRESWSEVYKRNQRKFTLQLIIGVAMFGFTLSTIYRNITLNGTPEFVRKTDFHTKEAPSEIREDLAGIGNHYVGLDGLSEKPEVAKIQPNSEEEKEV